MTIEGIYSITFRGAADWGMGLLLMRDKKIIGADAGGVMYDGTFEETTDAINADVVMTVPPGVALVQGVPPKPTEQKVPFSAKIPKASLETHEPVLLKMPMGPVNVIFKRLRPF